MKKSNLIKDIKAELLEQLKTKGMDFTMPWFRCGLPQYDFLKYVDRTSSFAYIPTDVDDVKPFFLAQIKDVVDSLIEKVIADDPERAKFYRLMEDNNA